MSRNTLNSTTSNSKKHAVIYTRISVKDETSVEGASLQAQEHRCRQFLQRKGVAEEDILVLCDDGHSGGSYNRPSFEKLLTLVNRKKVQSITATEISRLSRETIDSLMFTKLCSEQQVQLNLLDLPIDINTPTGDYLLDINIVTAKYERQKVIERSKNAAYSRAVRGLWNGSFPLGYKRGATSGLLDIEEESAHLVRLMYELFFKLGSVRAVQDRLNQLGYYRPDRMTSDGSYIPVAPHADSTIRNILRNRVYLGQRELNPQNKDKDQASLRETERYECVQGKWEAIIDESLWQKVQDRMNYNALRRGTTANIKHKQFILHGFAVCAECGAILSTDSAKSNTYFYYVHPDKNTTCSVKRWPAHKLELPFLKEFFKFIEEAGYLQRVLERYEDKRREKLGQSPKRIKELEAQVKQLKRKRNTLIDTMSTLDINLMSSFKQRLQQVLIELDSKEDELSNLRLMLKINKVESSDVQAIADKIYKNLEVFTKQDAYFTRLALMHFIERVEISGHDQLKFCLRKNHAVHQIAS
jgi:site-specific DNA recombinase